MLAPTKTVSITTSAIYDKSFWKMTLFEFKSQRYQLFGRGAVLDQLRRRAEGTGLTAIVGPPQVGKTSLLLELAYQLARDTDPPYLVGFLKYSEQPSDPFLRVVNDLYQRWLHDAGAWDQLKMVWEQQRDKLLPAFAKFTGKLSEKAAKLVPGLGELWGTAIKEALDGLVAVSDDLRAGILLPPLEFTQVRELISSSAPTRRIGTFGLTVSLLVPFPLASPDRFSSSIQEPK